MTEGSGTEIDLSEVWEDLLEVVIEEPAAGLEVAELDASPEPTPGEAAPEYAGEIRWGAVQCLSGLADVTAYFQVPSTGWYSVQFSYKDRNGRETAYTPWASQHGYSGNWLRGYARKWVPRWTTRVHVHFLRGRPDPFYPGRTWSASRSIIC